MKPYSLLWAAGLCFFGLAIVSLVLTAAPNWACPWGAGLSVAIGFCIAQAGVIVGSYTLGARKWRLAGGGAG